MIFGGEIVGVIVDLRAIRCRDAQSLVTGLDLGALQKEFDDTRFPAFGTGGEERLANARLFGVRKNLLDDGNVAGLGASEENFVCVHARAADPLKCRADHILVAVCRCGEGSAPDLNVPRAIHQ